MAKRSKYKNNQFELDSNNALNLPPQQKKNFHHKDLIRHQPITDNQKTLFSQWKYDNTKSFLLTGCPGTGKSFLSLYMALDDMLSDIGYDRIIIVRSPTPTIEIGFTPGTEEEKLSVYETPYIDICDKMFKFSKSYESLKKLGKIQFTSTAFLRGSTYDNCIIIFDEAQSADWHQIYTVLTRVGNNSKIFVCGDIKQNDLRHKKNMVTGFPRLEKIASLMEEFFVVNFQVEDIVRSGFVKNLILADMEVF